MKPLHPFNSARPQDFFPSETPSASYFLPDVSTGKPIPETSQSSLPEILPFCENSPTETAAKLEAVLFLSREPLSGRRLAQLAELPEGAKVRTLVNDLNRRYDERNCAFRVVEVAGGFQLRTRPQLAAWLVRMQEVPVTVQLSPSALETLSVIAYRQPVLRAEIERIRSVQCGELIRQLLEKDLIKIVGRSEELGRPFFYGTTKRFLQVFGLGSLRELPRREIFDTPEPLDAAATPLFDDEE